MIVVDGSYGGLCNQMFTFANLIAFAAEHDLLVVNPMFSEQASSFEYFNKTPACGFPKSKIKRLVFPSFLFHHRTVRYACKVLRRGFPTCQVHLGEKQELDLDNMGNQQTARLASAALSVVSGFYFVGHQTFARHAELIREVFKPVSIIRAGVTDVLKKARRDVDVLVGVHVRQGDYRTFRNGLSFFTSQEYLDVMRKVVMLFPDKKIGFVVCSNEKQDGNFSELQVTPGPGDPLGDLYSLAGCDYIIGPGSTFTQWASFYGSVPRYVMAWKWEVEEGRSQTPLNLSRFYIHTTGFGSRLGSAGS